MRNFTIDDARDLTLTANKDLIDILINSIKLYANAGENNCIIDKSIDLDKAVWCLEQLGFYAKIENNQLEVRW